MRGKLKKGGGEEFGRLFFHVLIDNGWLKITEAVMAYIGTLFGFLDSFHICRASLTCTFVTHNHD